MHRFENYILMLDGEGRPIELGRGAMGVTYKAFDVDLRCPVTLKVINERYVGDESARRRFLREARAAANFHHSNVASVFHLGRSGPDYFYAMEFVEGETLENFISVFPIRTAYQVPLWQDLGRRKFQSRDYPLQEAIFLAEKQISPSW
jgi:serine/threonine protein kinase